MRVLLLFLAVLFFVLQPLHASSSESIRFRTFSPKGGFYYDGVVDINQDKDGFIWVMLDKDLLRFDGYEYRKYTSQFNDRNDSDSWMFYNFATDASGDLHVLTSNGVYEYDINSDSLLKVVDVGFDNLAIDRQDNMWGLKDNVLHKIDVDRNNITRIFYDNQPLRNIRDYCFDDKKLFFASRNQIFAADSDKPEIIELLHTFPHNFSIVNIMEDSDGLWVLTSKNGIYRLNTTSGDIDKQFLYQNAQNTAQAKTSLVDKDGQIWIGTQFGLYIINPETGTFRQYRHSKSDPFSLTNNSVWELFEDYQGNIWIGHFAGGLCYADLDDNLQVSTFTSSVSALNYELVSSFAEHDDLVYIGMDGGGLNCLDKRTGIISQLRQEGIGNNPLYSHVKSLVVDSLDRLWIAMYRDGLDCLDLRTKKLHNFRNNPSDSTGLLYNDLKKVVLDRDSGLWISYQQNTRTIISYMSFDDYSCRHYDLGRGNGYVFDMQNDRNGKLYALTRQKLFRLNASSGTVEQIKGGHFSGGQSLAIDDTGNIWIGTIGHGLVKYSPSAGEFAYLTDILNSSASAVYSMCHDTTTDCLWLGTDNGLIQFDAENNSCRRFDDCDGFQGQVYYPLSVFRSSSGQMFFGGTNGFSIFSPGSISLNPRKPQARISAFYIDNQPVSPSLWKTSSELELNHDQANFGFRLSSDNYHTPEKNRFKYRLKGYDDDWITADASNRTAMYAKVPPGKYRFEVLAANNDGVWSDTPTVIRITRHPAPWASPVAYMIYFVLAAMLAGAIFYYWNEKRKLKIRLFMDTLDKQKKEELHKSQLRFFTNISHDFRTPISLILASIDNMKQDGIKGQYYRILHNNSRRLLNLVNELMDFRTLDNNKMKLHVERLYANALVKDLASDFDDFAVKRNIKFVINCDPELPASLYVDRQVLEKVVMNLLNNAFKYTPQGGEITVETYSAESKFSPRFQHSHIIPSESTSGNVLVIAVRDSGCGISADSIQDVFERYYQVNTTNLNNHLGTGIGLALVKSLVLLHHGGISIYSERNRGTDMVVVLPADVSAFKTEDLASEGIKCPDGALRGQISQAAVSASVADAETDLPSPGPELDEGGRNERKKIMLVEDNDDLRTLIAGFLKLHYDITEARDGVEALNILKDISVDIIISDVMMPKMDGITLCREVKENIETSHIPVMLLTARAGVEDRIEGAGAGADLYFAKPIDFNLLLQSVRNIFRHQQNLRDHYSRNYYADKAELTSNRQDTEFINKITDIIDAHLEGDNIDVNLLANELCMSRSKLYSKLKALTGKSIVEFILNYRMHKAARLIVEQDVPLYQVMEQVGIRSQSHFVNSFKKEFGETPSAFMARHRKKTEKEPDTA